MLVYCATSNSGKLREFQHAAGLVSSQIRIEMLPNLKQIPPPEETGATFEENAALKATYYSGFVAESVFADDSGLAVDALDGAPGVYSARFAGENATDAKNNALLLEKLRDQPDRSARFVCVIALARQGKVLGCERGEAEGEILTSMTGTGGFGYDPLFFSPEAGRTFAELDEAAKFAISHRGRAFRKFLSSTLQLT
jgi:XTP/dITP diphosphohydrolase